MNDTFQVYFFGGHQGKSILQVKPHLVAKTAQRPGPGPVRFLHPVFQYMTKKLMVLQHTRKIKEIHSESGETVRRAMRKVGETERRAKQVRTYPPLSALFLRSFLPL
jgi:hypothetical protein